MRLKFKVLQLFKDSKLWFRRWNHTRGYGVQSPWAYSLIREVFKEDSMYYAYEELGTIVGTKDATRLKLCELYFRMANHFQPALWLFGASDFEAEKVYVNAGCHNCRISILSFNSVQTGPIGKKVLLYRMTEDCHLFDYFVNLADKDSILIVENIHQDMSAYRRWKQMLQDTRTGISFDLYHCGIIFFDLSMFKQHYSINL